MLHTALRTFAFVALALTLAACSKDGPAGAGAPGTAVGAPGTVGGPPGTEAGARELLTKLLDPSADHAALSKALRPTTADYEAVYGKEAGAKLEATYGPAWDAGKLVIKPNEGQTELKLWSATAEDLKAGTGNAREFPGGYKQVAGRLQSGVTLYRFKFVKPDSGLGMAFDGLVHVNGHWVIIPKPWRTLGE
ncbi:MAG: hypothetical protein H6706_05895 [Myxococcales bacterium]|nr:hypothetical protein [Myxococcales bacterium]